ncbi:MAG TPA: YedE family putative selenium transporter [Candidatus Krumholzibacteria bacterium]|nr:YedE family putative selenium transporter [Candidatus Krumholzibacteria bacterium]HPD72680.1 YedE family putative selenium transporter [Candidatus Krumholzibacteria bacterium]HRY40388.1 YedE family putative selenium transporter [Candidatus Krumholzibacteria bacterium]
MKNFFATRTGIVTAGVVIGSFAAVLQKVGNPANMGLCMACFERDTAGALALHRAGALQYIRPEIIGILLGACAVSLRRGEFRSRGGSSAVVRFFLGAFAMIGALVFLGCPWRAFLRLAGGDLNAIAGILGLAAGVFVGAQFLKRGFSLGRSRPAEGAAPGWVLPAAMVGLLALALADFGPLAPDVTDKVAPHAPLWISLGAGLVIGGLAQRSRFCTMGALRDLFIVRDVHLLLGVAGFAVAAFALNLAFGQFHAGFAGQPAAHTQQLWNFLGMVLAGLSFALAGGCPGRQLILAGEGDSDSAVFVLGMFAGAAFAHNFALASSGKGAGQFGPAAVVIGLVFALVVAAIMTRRRPA